MVRGTGTECTKGNETTIPTRVDRTRLGTNILRLAQIDIIDFATHRFDWNVRGKDLLLWAVFTGVWWPFETEGNIGRSTAGRLLFFDRNGNRSIGIGHERYTNRTLFRRMFGSGGSHGILDRVFDSVSQIDNTHRQKRRNANLVAIGLLGVFWNGSCSGLVDVGLAKWQWQ